MCVFQHGERGISIHSLRMEGDMRSSICGGTRKNFNPLPPHGGSPKVIAFYFGTQTISIHSLRMEGDSRKTLTIMYFVSFQSTPSAWRETTPRTYFRKRPLHFNPLPPHGGRPVYAFIGLPLEYPGQVSLHAEGDRYPWSHCRRCRTRSGLPPCGGRQNHTPKNPPQGAPGQVSLHAEGDGGIWCRWRPVWGTRSGLPPCGGRPHDAHGQGV